MKKPSDGPTSLHGQRGILAWVLTAWVVGCGGQQTTPDLARAENVETLARFDPSPIEVVNAMFELAAISASDVVYDLGSGDGRVVIEAARRFHCRGVGIEMDPVLVELSRRRAEEAGVAHLVEIRQGDLLQAEISPATVVMIFLSPRGNAKLQEKLQTRLRPGARIISHCHGFEGWPPEKTLPVTTAERDHKVFAWTVRNAEVAPNLGPFVPTPMPVVRLMLEMARVGPQDKVYDLGCGDGRVVIEAARAHGARGVGIEYDARLCEEARDRAEREGVADRIEIRHADITQSDFSDATVVALYLLPKSNALLRPRLEALPRGTRIVAHDFVIGDWKPLEKRELWLRGETDRHTVYIWEVGR